MIALLLVLAAQVYSQNTPGTNGSDSFLATPSDKVSSVPARFTHLTQEDIDTLRVLADTTPWAHDVLVTLGYIEDTESM